MGGGKKRRGNGTSGRAVSRRKRAGEGGSLTFKDWEEGEPAECGSNSESLEKKPLLVAISREIWPEKD